MEKGINSFTIEMNSLVITNMLKNMNTTNLKLKKILYDTNRSVSNVKVNFTHCYREANMVVDYFVNMSSTNENETYFSSWHSLPEEVKCLI